ncbi:hypothetical protein BDN72DRAFT_835875 [Pluteus cervinus]|uniref:Uncharacterized protein n=1 Tax=Pluteus cervinus TaxID=181527 RepID=A0ACD3B3T6_9AGAR|nr:hypothetical protein BDN72DRAFT_835875 [Pluteus cervinus]
MTQLFPKPSIFQRLPVELIGSVLEQLDISTLLRCTQICRQLRLLIKKSVALQYKIELYACNMVDGPPSNVVKAARLRMLHAHQRAWRRIEWSGRSSIPLSEPEVSTESAWEFLGGVLGLAAGQRLRFIQVPSALRGIEEKHWVIENIGFRIKDFGMDPAQDLLSIIEISEAPSDETFTLHIRSLSTGEPHPLAQVCKLPYRSTFDVGEWWYVIQVHGHQVAIMCQSLSGDESELVVYDWQTGVQRKIILGFIQTYSFLNERYLMLGVTWDDPDGVVLSLEVIDLDEPPSVKVELSQGASHCAFQFPALRDLPEDPELAIRTDHTSQANTPLTKSVPFTTSQDDRLLVISSTCFSESKSNVLFVPLSAFLNKINLIPTEFSRGHIYPWETWGPDNTRMIEHSLSDVWFCYVHGMKVVVPLPDEQTVMLYDFNQRGIKRSLAKSTHITAPAPPSAPTTITLTHPPTPITPVPSPTPAPLTPTITPFITAIDIDEPKTSYIIEDTLCPTQIFKQPLKTSLPCLIHTFPSPIPRSGSGFMLGEDSLIVIPPNDGEFVLLSF